MRYLLSVMCAVAISVSGVWAESGLPKALIIGDSISNGYTPPLQEIMKDKAVVLHHPGNAAHTANGVAKLDEWLGDTQWDVSHFNFGLHDRKYSCADG